MKNRNQRGEILIGTFVLGAWFFGLAGVSVGHTIAENRSKDQFKMVGLDPEVVAERFEKTRYQEIKKPAKSVKPTKVKKETRLRLGDWN